MNFILVTGANGLKQSHKSSLSLCVTWGRGIFFLLAFQPPSPGVDLPEYPNVKVIQKVVIRRWEGMRIKWQFKRQGDSVDQLGVINFHSKFQSVVKNCLNLEFYFSTLNFTSFISWRDSLGLTRVNVLYAWIERLLFVIVNKCLPIDDVWKRNTWLLDTRNQFSSRGDETKPRTDRHARPSPFVYYCTRKAVYRVPRHLRPVRSPTRVHVWCASDPHKVPTNNTRVWVNGRRVGDAAYGTRLFVCHGLYRVKPSQVPLQTHFDSCILRGTHGRWEIRERERNDLELCPKLRHTL